MFAPFECFKLQLHREELQISVEAVSWLRTHGSELAEAVDDIFTAQAKMGFRLGELDSKDFKRLKDVEGMFC